MKTSQSIDVFEKGTDRFICSFELGFGPTVDNEHEAYAKSFVLNHNKTCTCGGS